MARRLLMEEFHVSLFVPSKLPEREVAAVRRALDSTRLHAEMRQAIGGVFRSYRALSKVQITLSR